MSLKVILFLILADVMLSIRISPIESMSNKSIEEMPSSDDKVDMNKNATSDENIINRTDVEAHYIRNTHSILPVNDVNNPVHTLVKFNITNDLNSTNLATSNISNIIKAIGDSELIEASVNANELFAINLNGNIFSGEDWYLSNYNEIHDHIRPLNINEDFICKDILTDPDDSELGISHFIFQVIQKTEKALELKFELRKTINPIPSKAYVISITFN